MASPINPFSACQRATENTLPEFCMCCFLGVSFCFGFCGEQKVSKATQTYNRAWPVLVS